MKIMRRAYTYIIICVLAITMPTWTYGMTADQVLQKTARQISKAPSLSATFTATTGDGARTSGTYTMSGRCFSLVSGNYASWYDGSNLWSYSRASGETSLTAPTAEELIEINPLQVITGNSRSYKAKMISQDKNKYVLELTPLSKSSSVSRAIVTISARTWLPVSVDASFSNSARISISIPSAKIGKALPKSTFTYPAARYKGVEVIDLR